MQSLPQTAPGILSWDEKDLSELYSSTTRDVKSQINAVTGDWRDVVRCVEIGDHFVLLVLIFDTPNPSPGIAL